MDKGPFTDDLWYRSTYKKWLCFIATSNSQRVSKIQVILSVRQQNRFEPATMGDFFTGCEDWKLTFAPHGLKPHFPIVQWPWGWSHGHLPISGARNPQNMFLNRGTVPTVDRTHLLDIKSPRRSFKMFRYWMGARMHKINFSGFMLGSPIPSSRTGDM